MENVVINAKMFNGFFVQFPYGSHLDFVATSYRALLDGLKAVKYPYKPKVYAIDTYGKPKFRKMTSAQMKTIYSEIGR